MKTKTAMNISTALPPKPQLPRTALALAISSLAATLPVAAQVAQGHIEELVVTAQKRTQSTQDVGIAIAAIGAESMRELGIESVAEALDYVPGSGFHDVTGGGVPVVVVRGVGLQNFRVNDTPSTAIYIDDVYQSSVAMAANGLFDLERLEILKGPQGGLYGRNAVGGAVQLISQKPSFDETTGYASFGYGRYQRRELEGAIGGPLSDTVAARLSGRYVKSDDTQYRSRQGFNHGAADSWGLRGQVALRPSDISEWLLKIDIGEDRTETPLLRPRGVWQPDLGLGIGAPFQLADGAAANSGLGSPSLANVCSAVIYRDGDPARCQIVDGRTEQEAGINGRYVSDSNLRPALDNQWHSATLRAEFDFDSYRLSSISAYTDFDHGRLVDFDGVGSSQQHIDYSSEFSAWSQELRLSYDAGDKLLWIAGLNYAEDKLDESTLASANAGILQAFGLPLIEQPYQQQAKSIAAYGHLSWQLSDSLGLIIEARYTREQKSLYGGTRIGGTDIYLGFADNETRFSAPSGKLALEWKPDDNSLYYASIARGFKSGGYFGGIVLNDAALKPFDEEQILAYEIGFKTDWEEPELRFNGAAFYYQRRDIQASGFDPTGPGGGVNRLANIGDARVSGAELELSWLASERLSLSASAAYLDSEIDSDVVRSDIFVSAADYSFDGAQLANQPELSANLVARYELPLSDDFSLGLQAEYLYTGRQDLRIIVNPAERRLLQEPGYGLLNLRLILSPSSGEWSATAFVSNLSDRHYRTVVAPDDTGNIYEIYGQPRLWGLRFEQQF
ncbi:MAG: TonB-dependent receptor [Cellvibrionaceae bacterium]|nr:TonB-dependent receptor [Cellvibrionaceae bacterium]